MGGWDRSKEVSPAQALQTAGAVAARAPKTLTVTLAALEEVRTGARLAAELGPGEAHAVLEHIATLTTTAKAATSKASQTERAHNTARAENADLDKAVREMRRQVQELISRGEELLGRLT